jgi:hypothetical protein
LAIAVLIASSLAPSAAVAQTWTTFLQKPIVTAGSTDSKIRFQFLMSKGAYADAVVLDDTTVPGSCALDNLASACLKYTGDCSQIRNPSYSCLPDSNASPGDINCWCQAPPGIDAYTVPAGTSKELPFKLYVDTNLDAKTEVRFDQGSNQSRVYPLAPEFVRIDWEDMEKPSEGDFNDYSLAIMEKHCDKFHWPDMYPESARPKPGFEECFVCSDTCKDNPCSSDQLCMTPLAFKAFIGIDKSQGEGKREDRGRTLTLTLNSYNEFPRSPDAMAICPILRIGWPRGRSPGETSDLTTPVRYGSTTCGATTDQSGEPLCLAPYVLTSAMPLALASEQLGSKVCTSRSMSDLYRFVPPPPDECGKGKMSPPFAFSKSYDIPLSWIDDALQDPSLKYGGLTDQQVIDLITDPGGLDVLVFDRIRSKNFYCPSGVNVSFDSVAPDVARVMQVTLDVKVKGGLVPYPRQ